MEILRDLFNYLKARKKWILAPVILILLIIIIVLVVGGSSGLGTYIYTLF